MEEPIDLWQYAGMERLDGVPVHWTGKHFRTGSGGIIKPAGKHPVHEIGIEIEGVLWCGRGKRALLDRILASRPENLQEDEWNQDWNQIWFVMTDVPGEAGDYAERFAHAYAHYEELSRDQIAICQDWRFEDENQLQAKLGAIARMGGCGIRLIHRKNRRQPGDRIEIPCKPLDTCEKAFEEALSEFRERIPGLGDSARKAAQSAHGQMRQQGMNSLRYGEHLDVPALRACMEAAVQLHAFGEPRVICLHEDAQGSTSLCWGDVNWNEKQRIWILLETPDGREAQARVLESGLDERGHPKMTKYETATLPMDEMIKALQKHDVKGFQARSKEELEQALQGGHLRTPRTPLPPGGKLTWDIFKEKYADGVGRDNSVEWPTSGPASAQQGRWFRVLHNSRLEENGNFPADTPVLFALPGPGRRTGRAAEGLAASLDEIDVILSRFEAHRNSPGGFRDGADLERWIQRILTELRTARHAIQKA